MNARISPNVRSVSAEPTQLNIVSGRTFAFAKYSNQLMLRAIKTAHPSLILRPHAQVEEIVVNLLSDGNQISDMPPIHENEMCGTALTKLRKQPKSAIKKGDKFW